MPELISEVRKSLPELNESTAAYLAALLRQFALSRDLRTYDPYDIWKTRAGFLAKGLYNRRPLLALPIVAPLALFDNLLNSQARIFYKKAEYPIVRALAALSLTNAYRARCDKELLAAAKVHLDWLSANYCTGYSGLCWGLGFDYAVRRDIIYRPNTPLATMTPYALEAFVEYLRVSGDESCKVQIDSIMRFFDHDLCVMSEDVDSMATSYGPYRDRVVVNAVSYNMFANALYLPYASAGAASLRRETIGKLYGYIRRMQREDGSWFYSSEGRPFIDCFHTCIVLKNLIKTTRTVSLRGCEAVIAAGYDYLKRAFLDQDRFLFRRFSLKNKQGLIRFDLYDNAEALNAALLMGDRTTALKLVESIVATFCRGRDVYSAIDFLGVRRNRNTLRWAVMPFIYAASQMV